MERVDVFTHAMHEAIDEERPFCLYTKTATWSCIIPFYYDRLVWKEVERARAVQA